MNAVAVSRWALVVTGLLAAFRAAAAAPSLQVERQPIVDRRLGLVAATIDVPKGWKLTADVQWRYQDVSAPVRIPARVEAPDGSAWVELFPIEIFYWLQPVPSPVPVGARSLGMIHAPNVRVDDALRRFVIAPARGKRAGLKIVGSRQVHGLPEAFGQKPFPGEARAYRLRYQLAGKVADEDVFGMLGEGNRVPYQGPQGLWYESHRPLVFAHALGATDGKLEAMRPLLAFIATSVKVDEAWQRRHDEVVAQLSQQFNQSIQAGYAQIAAAGAASRAISAQNDAMLASMGAARQAQAQRDALRRAQPATSSGGDEFDQYIRGTQKMKDPYWGESERSNTETYHWTDGQGRYQSSNDPTFDPNVGAGGGANWQRMEPAGR